MISLKKLRSKISFIPIDSALFAGTLRFNLDPFCKYSDEKLLSIIEEVGLEFVGKHSEGLNLVIDSNKSLKLFL